MDARGVMGQFWRNTLFYTHSRESRPIRYPWNKLFHIKCFSPLGGV